VNLQRWITADHASITDRLTSSIVRHVPQELWIDTPPGGGSSLTWLLLHMTYHQDLALNTAVRNQAPLLAEHRMRLGLATFATAAGLSETEDRDVTKAVELLALMNYVEAVAQATTKWIDTMSAMAFDSVPNANWRLEHKALVSADEVPWLHAMWQERPVSWFIQWECLGHRHTHLGEMTSIRNRLGFSPF
jgi:hypothetical protein